MRVPASTYIRTRSIDGKIIYCRVIKASAEKIITLTEKWNIKSIKKITRELEAGSHLIQHQSHHPNQRPHRRRNSTACPQKRPQPTATSTGARPKNPAAELMVETPERGGSIGWASMRSTGWSRSRRTSAGNSAPWGWTPMKCGNNCAAFLIEPGERIRSISGSDGWGFGGCDRWKGEDS